MPKQKTPSINKNPRNLYAIIVVLLLACATLGFMLVHGAHQINSSAASPSISLGAMQYTFVDGRAVKRNDASVQSLKAFLTTVAVHEGCPVQSPAYEHVVAYSKDETQVFIKYGCGAADSPIFAIKSNNTWRMVSPTNHFDLFAIPDCDYVAKNGISQEIAPVCANNIQVGVPTATPKYAVR